MRTHNLDTQSGHIRVSTPDFEQNRGRRKFGNSTAKASLQAVAAAVSSKLHNTARARRFERSWSGSLAACLVWPEALQRRVQVIQWHVNNLSQIPAPCRAHPRNARACSLLLPTRSPLVRRRDAHLALLPVLVVPTYTRHVKHLVTVMLRR